MSFEKEQVVIVCTGLSWLGISGRFFWWPWRAFVFHSNSWITTECALSLPLSPIVCILEQVGVFFFFKWGKEGIKTKRDTWWEGSVARRFICDVTFAELTYSWRLLVTAGCIYISDTRTTRDVFHVPVACRHYLGSELKYTEIRQKGKLQCDYMLQETKKRFVNRGS